MGRKPVVLLPGLICNERAHDTDDCDLVCNDFEPICNDCEPEPETQLQSICARLCDDCDPAAGCLQVVTRIGRDWNTLLRRLRRGRKRARTAWRTLHAVPAAVRTVGGSRGLLGDEPRLSCHVQADRDVFSRERRAQQDARRGLAAVCTALQRVFHRHHPSRQNCWRRWPRLRSRAIRWRAPTGVGA